MNLYPTWKAFFASRESNAAGNNSPNSYLMAWSDTVPPEAKLQLLTNDPSTAILAGDYSNGIMILHSFKNLGGTILSPPDNYVCLIGATRSAPIVTVNNVAITETCNIITPSIEDILACNDLEELLNLTAPLNDTIGYSGSTTFLPPPWLLNAVIDAQTDDPFKLILAVKQAATTFNSSQLAANPTYMPNTAPTVNHFVTWAWGVKNNLILPTTYFINPNDTEIDNYHTFRHQMCISPTNTLPAVIPPAPPAPAVAGVTLPGGEPPMAPADIIHPGGEPPIFVAPAPPAGGEPPITVATTPPTVPTTITMGNDAILRQLTVSITRQMEEAATHNELIARQLEHNLEKEDKKKDRLKKFHSSIKQLILFASADDAENVPDEIRESCKRVFNAETITNAEQELTLQFGNLGMQDATFAPGFVSALYSGKFLWNRNFTPSNFSPFMIGEGEPLLSAEQQPRRFVLHLEDTKGKTSDEMVAGGKNTIKAPTTYHEMHQQLKYFHGACSIFFGPTSIACTSLNALLHVIDKNKHILKALEVDTEFMSKFLLAIDKRFQLWFENCMTLNARTDVEDGILNFIPLIDMVRFGTFDLRLPLTFKLEVEKSESPKANKRAGGVGGQQEGTGGNKNNNKKQKQSEPRIPNSTQPEQFKMRTGETWPTTFANKNIQGRVQWDANDETIKMCPRWFTGGYCFANCHHKSSHVTADEIPADKMSAYKAFIDNIRGGN